MKQLIIEALNRAIVAYVNNGGRVCTTDVVVDCNLENIKVATLCERHPGALKIYVKLEEGSGIVFLGWDVEYCYIFPWLAWEEDNKTHSWRDIFRNSEGRLKDAEGNSLGEKARQTRHALNEIIENFLMRY